MKKTMALDVNVKGKSPSIEDSVPNEAAGSWGSKSIASIAALSGVKNPPGYAMRRASAASLGKASTYIPSIPHALAFYSAFVLSAAMFNSACADLKSDAVEFLNPATSQIRESCRCFNYETLTTILKDGDRLQKWARVRSSPEGVCAYSGATRNPELAVPSPEAWHSDSSVVISERDFFSVELSNDRYTARFYNKGRLQKGAGKVLTDVKRTVGAKRPDLLMMMLGETIIQDRVLDFIRSPGTDVLEFTDAARDGRPVKKLVVNGQVAQAQTHRIKSLNRFAWEFDAETGYCVYSNGGQANLDVSDLEYSIDYSASKQNGVLFPERVNIRSGRRSKPRTLFVRNCSVDCVMEPRESFLSYHGFKEPTFPADRTRMRAWLIWANVGIILIILAFLLRRRVQKSAGLQ